MNAPVSGTLVKWLVGAGIATAANVPVAELTYSGFGLVAALAPEDSYRILTGVLTAKGEITNGPGPFACPVLQASLPSGSGTTGSGAATGPEVVCAIPSAISVFDGLSGLMALTSGQATNVLLLPTTAVDGSAETGEVYVVTSSGGERLQQVSLGLTDGGLVEIEAGLRLGERVAATPPSVTS